ncbi:hsp70 family protein [Plantactinospora sp. KBS50]|uniref:hsp70 family protein n=1 Tax=Plantactinospora sp. KBS50 TaxID=2024580 RepID=UPI000BAAE234|nr:hsp70 family protein [Plantactinospora sp. KBS50]ASW56305.1 heat-shock protein Hsp70 [Plantactinospora sp. KBS50]
MADQHDGFALAVDLGTSNTVAVLRRPDGRTRPLLFDGRPILPSGVYVDAAGRLHAGADAQRLASADPTRFEPYPKSRISEPAIRLGDTDHPPAELLAAILRTVAETAVAAIGFLPPAIVTCPATWEAGQRHVLGDALVRAGWPPAAEHTISGPVPRGTRLLREPVAAARYYVQLLRRPVPVGGAIAVFDFGGGTLDVAVLRNEGADPWGDSGFTVLSVGGTELGGVHLDAALAQRLGAEIAAAHPAEWSRIATPASAVAWRDRHRFWENVRGAKEMLSRTGTAPVVVPGLDEPFELTRDELERVTAPLLSRAVAETRKVIAAAGLAPADLTGLFLVGGSSRMPLAARLLHTELGVAPTVLDQPELPVAEGALTDLPTPALAQVRAPVPEAVQVQVPAPVPAAVHAQVPGAVHAQVPGAVHAPGAGAGAVPPVPNGYTPNGPAASGTPAGAAARPAARRAWWIAAAAVVALAGVVLAGVLYLTRERYPDLDFRPISPLRPILAGEDRPTDMFTALLEDRAYLAYPVDRTRIEVIAADAGTGQEKWRHRTISTGADRWAGVVALPGAVAVLADVYSDDTPRDLIMLDAGTGAERWRRPIRGDDGVLYGARTLVLVDRNAGRLVGLDLRTGDQRWTLDSPQDSSGSTRTSVYPVTRDAAVAGPSGLTGGPRYPWLGDAGQLVQVGADRSVRLVDVDSGTVVRQRRNVARYDDLMAVHEDRLFVADDDGGYRLLAYDLNTLAEPRVLYTAPDDDHRPKALVPCGKARACLLEVAGYDAATAEVVVAAEGTTARRWAAPDADTLVPAGDRLLVQGTSSEVSGTLFDADGKPLLRDRRGVGVRLDEGNLLFFSDQPNSSTVDLSVAGVWSRSGKVTELGLLPDVRGESCSWNSALIVCGGEKTFTLYRLTDD